MCGATIGFGEAMLLGPPAISAFAPLSGLRDAEAGGGRRHAQNLLEGK
jgi:hypothetical protein